MAFEKNTTNKSVSVKNPAQSDFMRNHPNRGAILEHAAKTGAPVPQGDHLTKKIGDEPQTSAIDADGIRHLYRSKDFVDGSSDRNTNALYRSLGYEIKEDEFGDGYEMTIPQDKFLANQARYTQQARDRVKQINPASGQTGEHKRGDWGELEQSVRVGVDDLLAGS